MSNDAYPCTSKGFRNARNRKWMNPMNEPAVALLGLGSAALLLLSGYLFGARRGIQARDTLHAQVLEQTARLEQVEAQLEKQEGASAEALSMVREVLLPLTRRERLAFNLSRLTGGNPSADRLTELLDQIADMGQFWGVLLSNDHGLPVAASANVRDMDRLAFIAALASSFADRVERTGAPAPLSLLLHDEANLATLCRIFRVGNQRLMLIAVSTGPELSPTALDPALAKVDSVMSREHSFR
jgi:hypothetical protein